MSYFSKFPLYRTRTTEGSQVIITDLFRRVRIGKSFGDVAIGLMPYVVLDGETPEMVSTKFYGTPFNHWIILLVNNIVNVLTEWPLESSALNEKVLSEYEDPYGVHHYYDVSSGYVVDRDDDNPNIISVSNFDYELSVNDGKRTIRILEDNYVRIFTKNFETSIGT